MPDEQPPLALGDEVRLVACIWCSAEYRCHVRELGRLNLHCDPAPPRVPGQTGDDLDGLANERKE